MNQETILHYECNNCGKKGKAKWGGMGAGDTLYLPDMWTSLDRRPNISKVYRGALCPDCQVIEKIKRKIYVASSWRNIYHQNLVFTLRKNGHEVYDFRNPQIGNHGFAWSEIDADWQDWETDEYIKALDHPIAIKGYNLDFNAMNWADTCILLLPCGRSAHTEAGWMKGAGKKVYVFIPERCEPELMYKIYDGIYDHINDLLKTLTFKGLCV